MKKPKLYICLLSLCIGLAAREAKAAEITCGSLDGELSHCTLAGANTLKVKLKHRIDGVCKFDESWGVDREGVWVDMGCRAIFKYTAPPGQQTGWKRFLPRWAR
jgi:hypothetical protein